ncbi:MAG: BolA family protein [Pseudomonadales bacterium]
MYSGEIHSLLTAHFESAVIEVSEQGGHYSVTVVSESMAGLSPVKRQQAVYAPLSDIIADGRVHAVNIRALTPAEHQ